MRVPALLLTVLAALPLMAPAGAQARADPPAKERIDESAKRVKELQKERIITLKRMVDLTAELVKNGRVSAAEMFEAQLLLFRAELDAAEKQSDRVEFHKKIVDVLKAIEKRVEAQHDSGRATPADVLKAKARRLEAEIDLEKAKIKEAEGNK